MVTLLRCRHRRTFVSVDSSVLNDALQAFTHRHWRWDGDGKASGGPSEALPHDEAWFLKAFHGVFRTGVGFGLL